MSLTTQIPLGTHLPGHPGHLGRERRQLVDHRVDGVRKTGDLAAGVHGDLPREITASHRRRHLGDTADLGGEVAGHDVHRVGEVPPHSGHALDLGLTAELALGADLLGHPRDLVGERRELVDHRVHGRLQLVDLALGVHGDLLGQIALRHRRGHLGDVADLAGQVSRHRVHRLGEIPPDPGHAFDPRLPTEIALGADLAGDPGDLVCE